MRAIEEGAADQQEIARNAAMDRPFVTALIRKLIEKGLVSGTKNRADRRRTDMRVTASGRRLVDRILAQIVVPCNAAAVSGNNANDLATFVEVAGKMIANLEGAYPSVSNGPQQT